MLDDQGVHARAAAGKLPEGDKKDAILALFEDYESSLMQFSAPVPLRPAALEVEVEVVSVSGDSDDAHSNTEEVEEAEE